MDYEKFVEQQTTPELDMKLKQLKEEKSRLREETSRLNDKFLSLKRRNDTILEQLKKESAELDMRVEEQEHIFESTKKQCEFAVESLISELKQDFSLTNKILIENKKKYHHLVFNLNEKKEIDETRRAMLAQEKALNAEYQRIENELNEKKSKIQTENLIERDAIKDRAEKSLAQQIEVASAQIKKERDDTLRKAESESRVLAVNVSKAQKAVVHLREKYNSLLELSNELEMQLMEAKLVTQLISPEKSKQAIQGLLEEKDRLEDERIKSRTMPDAENRRKLTQHLNMMKKKQNEINGFMTLNQMKEKEMNHLRAIAANCIEQRNSLMTFMNETITLLRKQIASSVNQKGLNFRTSELVLCHVADDDKKVLGRMFQGADESSQGLQEQLRYFEVFYSRFTGMTQPRKVEDVI